MFKNRFSKNHLFNRLQIVFVRNAFKHDVAGKFSLVFLLKYGSKSEKWLPKKVALLLTSGSEYDLAFEHRFGLFWHRLDLFFIF